MVVASHAGAYHVPSAFTRRKLESPYFTTTVAAALLAPYTDAQEQKWPRRTRKITEAQSCVMQYRLSWQERKYP